jgi:DNA-binding transcriptional ArsR family regulator
MDDFQPSPSLTIQDLETVKVLADPLRQQILECLTRERLTVKQIASRLGLAPGRLYYHVNLLEKHGLIRVVHTQLVSGIMEKHYRASALDYDVDRNLLSPGSDQGRESIHSMLAATLDATREDVLRSMDARFFELDQGAEERPRNVIIARRLGLLTAAQVKKYQTRLQALMNDMEKAVETAGKPGESTHPYALMLAFYPSFYFPESESQDRG